MQSKPLELDNKLPLYIPELKMTVYVPADKTVGEVRRQYLGQRAANRESLRVAKNTNVEAERQYKH
jgi:hypothetical protein